MGLGEKAAILALAGMTLVSVMSVSLPSPATSHVAGGVGSASNNAVWVVNAYLVANSIASPLAARLAERVGRAWRPSPPPPRDAGWPGRSARWSPGGWSRGWPAGCWCRWSSPP